jgi:DNA-binding NtrC family response regulator
MANILVLDDEADAVILLQKVLRKKGHVVHAFTEEEAALQFALTHPIDLAILDIKLKKMSGLQVLEELRASVPELSVMMLTGYPTIETAKEAAKLGVGQYCVKPIEISELEDKVAKLIAARSEH